MRDFSLRLADLGQLDDERARPGALLLPDRPARPAPASRATRWPCWRASCPRSAGGSRRSRPPGWTIHFKGGWGSGTGLVTHQSALLRRDGRAARALGAHALEPEPRLRDDDDPRHRGPAPRAAASAGAALAAGPRKRGARLSHLGRLRRPPRMTVLLVLSPSVSAPTRSCLRASEGAAGVGFEPTEPFHGLGGFQDRPFRPLGHPAQRASLARDK